jgi:hypothetical protein
MQPLFTFLRVFSCTYDDQQNKQNQDDDKQVITQKTAREATHDVNHSLL